MPRVLIVKLGAIGDVLMAIPAAHQLHLAGHTVDWVCGPAVLPLLQLYPWIHPTPVEDRALLIGPPLARIRALAKLWRRLLSRRYTLIATLYFDRRYQVLALPLRALLKLQLSSSHRATRILPARSYADEFVRILLRLPDKVAPTHTAPVPPPVMPHSPLPAPRTQRIVLVPAGARNMLAEATLRRWPAEHFVSLTASLLLLGFDVVLAGGPDDTWISPLFHPLACPALQDCIGTLSLVQTLGLLNSASLVVTHDTGPLHLAGLTQACIVALFGPTSPMNFLPRRPGVVALWGGEGFACRPCYDGHTFAPCPANDCMRQISPEMVQVQVLSLLKERAEGHLQPPRVIVPISYEAASALPTTLVQLAESRA